VEGFPDMQPSGNPVPVYGVAPSSQQSGSSSTELQQNLPQIKQQASADFLLPILYHSTALVSPLTDSTSSGSGSAPNSGSTFDTSNLTTRYVRVRN
jgi:hypothetical protein